MNWTLVILQHFVATTVGAAVLTYVLVLPLIWRGSDRATHLRIITLLFGVAAIGACGGLSGGLSRVGVVGAIIPAMFTLLGGLAVYLFGVDNSKGAITSVTSACFAIALFASYATGSQLRNTGDELRDLRSHCVAVYTNDKILSNADSLKLVNEKLGKWCGAALVWNLPQKSQ